MNPEIDRLDNQIAQLTEIRDDLTNHINVLIEHRERLGGKPVTRGNEYVSRIEFKKYVEIWIDLFNRQHGSGGATMLAENSNVSIATIKNIRTKEKQQWVELYIVDKMLRAMNMEHVLHLLTIYKGKNGSKWPEPPFSHFEEN